MSSKVSFAQYQLAVSNYEGWCSECNEFTTGSCEPDASERECDACGENTVTGAEMALVQDLFEV